MHISVIKRAFKAYQTIDLTFGKWIVPIFVGLYLLTLCGQHVQHWVVITPPRPAPFFVYPRVTPDSLGDKAKMV